MTKLLRLLELLSISSQCLLSQNINQSKLHQEDTDVFFCRQQILSIQIVIFLSLFVSIKLLPVLKIYENKSLIEPLSVQSSQWNTSKSKEQFDLFNIRISEKTDCKYLPGIIVLNVFPPFEFWFIISLQLFFSFQKHNCRILTNVWKFNFLKNLH